MKKSIVLFFMCIALGILVFPGFTAITLDWSVATGPIAISGAMRQPAFNPITGHMLQIQSDTTIWILNASNGNVIGELPRPIDGYGASPSPYGIAVDENGVIYATDDFYGTGPGHGTCRILRWTDETSIPTVAGSCGTILVRSLRLIGTGTNTKLVFPSGNDQNVRIFSTTDGLNYILEKQFYAADAVHDAVLHPNGNELWITGWQSNGASYTHHYLKSGTTWSEDSAFTKSNWILNLSYSIREKLYGAYWNINPGVIDGVREWNSTTGISLEQFDLGDTNEDAHGGYITVYNAPNPLNDKLYFAFANVGYGRLSIPFAPTIVVTPPSAVLTVGQTKQFSYTGISDPVVWSSSNPSVGTTNNTGLFYARATGSCLVIATYTLGTDSWSGTATVTVNPTQAPLAPDEVKNIKISHREIVGDIPKGIPITRSWELFE